MRLTCELYAAIIAIETGNTVHDSILHGILLSTKPWTLPPRKIPTTARGEL